MSRWAVSAALGVPNALREAQAAAQVAQPPGVALALPGAPNQALLDQERAEAAKAPAPVVAPPSNVMQFPPPQLVRKVTLESLLNDARTRALELREKLAEHEAMQKELAALEVLIAAGEGYT